MTKGVKLRLSSEEYQNYVTELLYFRADIKSIIGLFVPLVDRKRSPTSSLMPGMEWEALCPFHDEKTPSFTVSCVKRFYHCFGCGAHGDMRRFLEEYSGMGPSEQLRFIAQEFKYWPSTYLREQKERQSKK